MPSDAQARRRRDAATDDEALLADDAAGQDDDDTEALARIDGLDTTTTLDSAEGDAPVSAAAVEGGLMADLETARLTITPFTPALAGVALTGRARLGQALGVRVPDDWLEDDCEEILPLLAATVRDGSLDGADARWGWWLIVHRAERTLIGEVSFREAPDGTGTVEIGYGVVPAYQGRGYATEAVGVVVDWTLRQPSVARVVACCLRDNRASRRVLEKLGLRLIGTDGVLLVWERRRGDAR